MSNGRCGFSGTAPWRLQGKGADLRAVCRCGAVTRAVPGGAIMVMEEHLTAPRSARPPRQVQRPRAPVPRSPQMRLL